MKSRRNRKNLKHQSGHPGRGKPAVSSGQRRRARIADEAAGSTQDAAAIPAAGVRLNRWLAERGIGSRRKCDAMIQECAVEVNGSIMVEPGYRVKEGDRVAVEGRPVKEVRRLYYLFYKPKGVLCTDDPRETRTRVCDLVDPMVSNRVYSVGRLDEDSEGLLLLTNDGDFANLVMHPRYQVPKTYVVVINGSIRGEEIDTLRNGTWLSDGKVTPERIKLIRRTKSTSSLEVQLGEGRNREIRRIFAAFGYSVKSLKRVRIGKLGMKGLKRGAIRPLTRQEREDMTSLALDRVSGEEAESN